MDSEDRSTQKDTSSSAVTSSLSDLIARLEKATGPDRELDMAIEIALRGSEMTRFLDWLGYQLLMHGPHRIVCNPYTKFGTWCLQRAGGHAYRDHSGVES